MHSYELVVSRGHIWETTLFAMESLGVTPSPTLPLEFFQANTSARLLNSKELLPAGDQGPKKAELPGAAP